jgi:hypothetical protein
VGLYEALALARVERLVKYHPDVSVFLTQHPYRVRGHGLVGSLTGAVASQIVTEAHKGSLSLDGNQAASV